MNEPQVWTLIGLFSAIMLGGMTLMTTQFSRVIRAEISGLEGRLTGRIDALGSRIDALEHKVDALDREVANLATKFWRSS